MSLTDNWSFEIRHYGYNSSIDVTIPRYWDDVLYRIWIVVSVPPNNASDPYLYHIHGLVKTCIKLRHSTIGANLTIGFATSDNHLYFDRRKGTHQQAIDHLLANPRIVGGPWILGDLHPESSLISSRSDSDWVKKQIAKGLLDVDLFDTFISHWASVRAAYIAEKKRTAASKAIDKQWKRIKSKE